MTAATLHTGLVLTGPLWPGGDADVVPHAVVVVDQQGLVSYAGPAAAASERRGALDVGWIGPGIIDAHVHLAFAREGAAAELRLGVVGVRDLGAPLDSALGWRSAPSAGKRGRGAESTAGGGAGGPDVWVAGPVLTAPDGYPSRSWGRDGFASFVAGAVTAGPVVDALAAAGVDVIKVALESAGGAPVPSVDTVRAIVHAAHANGLAVTAHALTRRLVGRALDGGVDELCHTPTEALSQADVRRIRDSGVAVVSTLHTFAATSLAATTQANAAALVAAGVPLIYGTDLGNADTDVGVDTVELELLAAAGLGRRGALRAATTGAVAAVGVTGVSGCIRVGEPARLVGLAGDPMDNAEHWHQPVVVVRGVHAIR